MYKSLIWLVCLMILLMLALLYRAFFLVTPSEEGIDDLRIPMIDQAEQDNITVEKEVDNPEIWQLLASPEIQVWYLLTLTDIELAAYAVTGPEDEQLNFLFQQQLLANIEIATKMRDDVRRVEKEVTRQKLKEQEAQRRREKDQRERGNDCGAWVATQMFVKQRLKSPSTASFGRWFEQTCSEVVAPLGNYRYAVIAFVDSQNSFGGIVRTYFTVVVREQTNKWILESIDIGE